MLYIGYVTIWILLNRKIINFKIEEYVGRSITCTTVAIHVV